MPPASAKGGERWKLLAKHYEKKLLNNVVIRQGGLVTLELAAFNNPPPGARTVWKLPGVS